jgi:hypothetical protein
MCAMIIEGMLGLGDNIYQRAFIKATSKPIWLATPWPELYSDIPGVNLIKRETKLRTQAKNLDRQPADVWSRAPHVPTAKIRYGASGIIPGMTQCFRVKPQEFDLPDFGPSPVAGKYVVVRPVTVRSEWRADNRNPLPQYVAQAAAEMRRRGYLVVSVADLEDNKEWLVGDPPAADITYHKGELPVKQLLALVQGAAAVIGGIGWIVPACIAAKVPAWIICGGQGGYNSPENITDPCMDLSRVHFAVPDRFCRCTLKIHNCNKRIACHDQMFADWADRLPALV